MSELKCPFCNQKLEPIGTSGQFQCGTWGCDASFNFIATRDVWEHIGRTRKALEIAWDGLEKIGSGNIIEHSVVGHEDDSKIFIANKALDESKTTLEQKDVK